jgi:hypothetical protein
MALFPGVFSGSLRVCPSIVQRSSVMVTDIGLLSVRSFKEHMGRPQTDEDMRKTWEKEKAIIKKLSSATGGPSATAMYFGSGHLPDADVVVRSLNKQLWWIAQEELGETLEEILTKSFVKSLLRMARALADLHSKGFTHGDVHRGNFMFSQQNGATHATLIDLGNTKQSRDGFRNDIACFGTRVIQPIPKQSEFSSGTSLKMLQSLDVIVKSCKNVSGFPSLKAAELVSLLESVSWHQFDAMRRQLEPSKQSYRILRCKHSNLLLDVPGYSTDDDALIIQWDAHGGTNQLFRFEEKADGYGIIRNKHSKLVFDIPGCSKEPLTPLSQYSENGGDNQLFRFEDKGGGYGLLRNKHSQLVLDVIECSLECGATICQYSESGGDNQLFCFEDISK